MTFRGKRDYCRLCGHTRAEHRLRLVRMQMRICTQTGSCECTGFVPAHLEWDAFEGKTGAWSVQSRATGQVFAGLPSGDAAEQLARTLTDLDDMLARINADGGMACAL
ncbi:hypothetical protein [Mycolicibacterium sp. A43C]